jgi:hypothetical protein
MYCTYICISIFRRFIHMLANAVCLLQRENGNDKLRLFDAKGNAK